MLKIEEIEILNFRSIIGKALKFSPAGYNVIVGPNNSGKSNILRALELFFNSTIDRKNFSSELDFPKFSNSSPKPVQISVELSYDSQKEKKIISVLNEIEKYSKQKRLDNNRIKLRLSINKNGNRQWQFIGKLGTKNIRQDLISKIVDIIISSVKFKYIPVGRDILRTIQEEISQELIKTIFSGWSGKAIKFRQDINVSLSDLINKLKLPLEKSSQQITHELTTVFSEIKSLNLQLPFDSLDNMLPLLIPSLEDNYATSLESKGAGLQTSSLIFFLKYLADNHPQRNNAFITFIWAIEEPESYLHPKRQKGISDILQTFSEDVQTFITTHSSNFVPRNHNVKLLVVDKSSSSPYSTEVIGNDYELARSTLGVSLIDSMILNEINIIVEGPSDEILLNNFLVKLFDNNKIKINPEKVKFFSASNALTACTLFETLYAFSEKDKINIILIVDGDEAGNKALNGLVNRMKTVNGVNLKSNSDYFLLKKYTESLLADVIKEKLHVERPAQISLTKNTDNEITNFTFNEGYKKKCAQRAVDLSSINDLKEFVALFKKIETALKIT